MSRAYASVRFGDGTVRAGLYNGTSDILFSGLFDTHGDAWAAYYPKTEGDKALAARLWPADCGDEGESVVIYCDYGAGHTWPGRACREHDQVTDGTSPWEDRYEEMRDEEPEWAGYIGRPS